MRHYRLRVSGCVWELQLVIQINIPITCCCQARDIYLGFNVARGSKRLPTPGLYSLVRETARFFRCTADSRDLWKRFFQCCVQTTNISNAKH